MKSSKYVSAVVGELASPVADDSRKTLAPSQVKGDLCSVGVNLEDNKGNPFFFNLAVGCDMAEIDNFPKTFKEFFQDAAQAAQAANIGEYGTEVVCEVKLALLPVGYLVWIKNREE